MACERSARRPASWSSPSTSFRRMECGESRLESLPLRAERDRRLGPVEISRLQLFLLVEKRVELRLGLAVPHRLFVLLLCSTPLLAHPLRLRHQLPRIRHRGLVLLATGTDRIPSKPGRGRSEEHTSELQSQFHLVCRLLLEKKKRMDGMTSWSKRDNEAGD